MGRVTAKSIWAEMPHIFYEKERRHYRNSDAPRAFSEHSQSTSARCSEKGESDPLTNLITVNLESSKRAARATGRGHETIDPMNLPFVLIFSYF